MTRCATSLVVESSSADAGQLKRAFVFRRCYHRHTTFHGVENSRCDCLRVELPIDAQARSSGALGTPDRNHTCPACCGIGKLILEPLGWATCPRCAGCGERDAKREPVCLSDRAIRKALTEKRASGLLGRRAK